MTPKTATPPAAPHSGEFRGVSDPAPLSRASGCAAPPFEGSHFSPRHVINPAGGSPPIPSHHGSFSAVTPVLVKIVLRVSASITFGLVFLLVPGATPKNPDSGLIACR